MDINNMTIGEAKEIARMVDGVNQKKNPSAFEQVRGEYVLLMCLNYNYYGRIAEINESFLTLDNAKLVYETGAWEQTSWEDAQELPSGVFNVMTSMIESWGMVKK